MTKGWRRPVFQAPKGSRFIALPGGKAWQRLFPPAPSVVSVVAALGGLPRVAQAEELLSYTVYRWECAVRASVVMGFVGAVLATGLLLAAVAGSFAWLDMPLAALFTAMAVEEAGGFVARFFPPALATFFYATLPLVAPQWLAYALYRWEMNIRMVAILGFVGAGVTVAEFLMAAPDGLKFVVLGP